jgi:hypothetical protein
MISEKQFWKIIQQSIEQKPSEDKNEQGDCLMEILTNLSVEQIAGFQNRMLQLREELNSPLMRDIASMMKFGDNNHAFEGFKNWVISLGEEHYNKAKNSPAYLLTLSDENLFVVGQAYFQDLSFVASGAFFDKTDLEFDDWYKALNDDKEASHDRKLPKKSDKSKDQDLER